MICTSGETWKECPSDAVRRSGSGPDPVTVDGETYICTFGEWSKQSSGSAGDQQPACSEQGQGYSCVNAFNGCTGDGQTVVNDFSCSGDRFVCCKTQIDPAEPRLVSVRIKKTSDGGWGGLDSAEGEVYVTIENVGDESETFEVNGGPDVASSVELGGGAKKEVRTSVTSDAGDFDTWDDISGGFTVTVETLLDETLTSWEIEDRQIPDGLSEGEEVTIQKDAGGLDNVQRSCEFQGQQLDEGDRVVDKIGLCVDGVIQWCRESPGGAEFDGLGTSVEVGTEHVIGIDTYTCRSFGGWGKEEPTL